MSSFVILKQKIERFFYSRSKDWILFGVFIVIPLILVISFFTYYQAGTRNLTLYGLMEGTRFYISLGDEKKEIQSWYDRTTDQYVVFLPSHAEAVWVSAPTGYSVGIGDFPLIEELDKIVPEQGGVYPIQYLKKGKDTRQSGSLLFVRSEHIPAMFIDTMSGNQKHIDAVKTNKEEGYMVCVDGDGHTVYSDSLMYIKGRGNTTFYDSPKKPYNICLPVADTLFGMSESQNWALLANYFDDSFIRNKLAFDTASRLSFDYTPDSEFVNLYMNGEYAGLYQLMEQVEIGESRLDIVDLSEQTAEQNIFPLNKYSRFKVETSNQIISGVNIPYNPEDITGGYLLELDFLIPYKDRPSHFYTNENQRVSIRSPEYASREQVAYISGLFQEFEDAVFSVDGKNPATNKKIAEYIDLKSWAHMYLIEEIYKDLDSWLTSNFVYKDSDRNDPLLYCGPAWDFDKSLGGFGERLRYPTGLHAAVYMRWFAQLYNQPEFYQAVVEEFENTCLPILREQLKTGIDEQAAYIASAARMDKIRWLEKEKNQADTGFVFDTWDANIPYIKDYLSRRLEFLENLWLKHVPYVTVTLKVDGYKYFFAAELGENLPDMSHWVSQISFDGFYEEGTDLRFDETIPVTKDATIYLRRSSAPSLRSKLRPIWDERQFVILAAWVVFYIIIVIASIRQGRFPKKGRRQYK